MHGWASPVDPDALIQYSVVYKAPSHSHTSQSFQGLVNDISAAHRKV